MEYGYEITDTAGNKTFFVEGCTYCRMSTGGMHELGCPYNKDRQYEPPPRSARFDPTIFYEEPKIPLDPQREAFYKKKGYSSPQHQL